eukprot:GHVU01170423.1.p3 GENE.GHVU01170423.1~~GHVU01170423.1.p3  ORF type:complete len:125 (-),score=9.24 GHVU01170423.1:675-1049(-)
MRTLTDHGLHVNGFPPDSSEGVRQWVLVVPPRVEEFPPLEGERHGSHVLAVGGERGEQVITLRHRVASSALISSVVTVPLQVPVPAKVLRNRVVRTLANKQTNKQVKCVCMYVCMYRNPPMKPP